MPELSFSVKDNGKAVLFENHEFLPRCLGLACMLAHVGTNFLHSEIKVCLRGWSRR